MRIILHIMKRALELYESVKRMGMNESQCRAVLKLSAAIFENASEFEDLEFADTVINAVRDSDIYSDISIAISSKFNGNISEMQEEFGFLSKRIVIFIDDGKITGFPDTTQKYSYSIMEYMSSINKGNAVKPDFMNHQHVICINYSIYKHANATGMFYPGYGNLAYIDIYLLKLMKSPYFITLLNEASGKSPSGKMYDAMMQLFSDSEEILIHEISHYITAYKEAGNTKGTRHDYKKILGNLDEKESERYKKGDISHFYSSDSGDDEYYKLLYNTDDDEINSCIKECAYWSIIKEKDIISKSSELNSDMSDEFMKKTYETIYKRMSNEMISRVSETLDFKRNKYPVNLRNKIMKRIYYVSVTFAEYAVRFPDQAKTESLADTLHGISKMDSAGFDFAMKINPDSPYAEDINNDAMNIRKKSHGMKGFFAKLFGKEE